MLKYINIIISISIVLLYTKVRIIKFLITYTTNKTFLIKKMIIKKYKPQISHF